MGCRTSQLAVPWVVLADQANYNQELVSWGQPPKMGEHMQPIAGTAGPKFLALILPWLCHLRTRTRMFVLSCWSLHGNQKNCKLWLGTVSCPGYYPWGSGSDKSSGRWNELSLDMGYPQFLRGRKCCESSAVFGSWAP